MEGVGEHFRVGEDFHAKLKELGRIVELGRIFLRFVRGYRGFVGQGGFHKKFK